MSRSQTSRSQVVDMHRWRARARVLRPAAPIAEDPAGTGADAGASRTGARVLPLPDPQRVTRTGRGPSSVFGPVMAFGLLPSAQAGAAAAAVAAEDTAAPSSASFGRTPRARHLVDLRGAPRGPRR